MCNCVCPYLKSAVRKWPTKRRNELDLPPEGHNLYPIKRFLGENLKTSETTETKTSENMFGKPENTSWKNDRNTTRTTNVASKTLFRHLCGVLCRGILPGWKLQVAGSIQKTKRIFLKTVKSESKVWASAHAKVSTDVSFAGPYVDTSSIGISFDHLRG